jgi:hypothetical protein
MLPAANSQCQWFSALTNANATGSGRWELQCSAVTSCAIIQDTSQKRRYWQLAICNAKSIGNAIIFILYNIYIIYNVIGYYWLLAIIGNSLARFKV